MYYALTLHYVLHTLRLQYYEKYVCFLVKLIHHATPCHFIKQEATSAALATGDELAAQAWRAAAPLVAAARPLMAQLQARLTGRCAAALCVHLVPQEAIGT
jgi:hypothetical protein